MAKYDLSEGVADEYHIESGLVCEFCRGKIVGGNKGDSLSSLLASNKVVRYPLLANCEMIHRHCCPPIRFGSKANSVCQIRRESGRPMTLNCGIRPASFVWTLAKGSLDHDHFAESWKLLRREIFSCQQDPAQPFCVRQA